MKYFVIYTLCFSVFLYVLDTYIFGKAIPHSHTPNISIQNIPEDIIQQYTEEEKRPGFTAAKEENITPVKQNTTQEVRKSQTLFLYKPDSFQELIEQEYVSPMKQLIEHPFFDSKISDFVVILYQNKGIVRGNMKNKVLRLYELERLGVNESFAVFLHELGHYIDLYHLKEYNDYDMSHEFYGISWETTKVMKAGMTESDFVSGYAASNSYEDFSESFLYYILHNADFAAKAETNTILKRKYDFFATVLFINREFKGSDFSEDAGESYQRDVTKIEFSLENFLEYLKKSI